MNNITNYTSKSSDNQVNELQLAQSNISIQIHNGHTFSKSISSHLKETEEKAASAYQTFEGISNIDLEKVQSTFISAEELYIAQAVVEFSKIYVALDFSFINVATENKFKDDLREIYRSLKQENEKLKDAENLIDQVVEKGELGKRGDDGTFIPLTKEEIEQLKSEFKKILIPYFQNQSLIKKQEKKEVDKEQPTHDRAEVGAEHIAVVISQRRFEPHNEKSVKVALEIEIIIQFIISNSINEKIQREKAEEKRERKLSELIDRIKNDVIKKEILNHEILKSEIKLTEFKNKLNNYITFPMEELVKISQVYITKVDNEQLPSDKKIYLRLPGMHKMKLMAGAAA